MNSTKTENHEEILARKEGLFMQTLRQSMGNQDLSSICDTVRRKQLSTRVESSDKKKEQYLKQEPSIMDTPSPSVLEKFTAGTNNGYQRNKVKL